MNIVQPGTLAFREADTGVETKFARLAHVVRGGNPTLRDRVLASVMGDKAVDLLLQGQSDVVICSRDNQIVSTEIKWALIVDRMFKGKLKGMKVVKVDEKEMELVRTDGKRKGKITWQKFYKDYPGNFNEIINAYIFNARNTSARVKLTLSEWADAMTGAALTMQLVCAEVNGAIERSEALAKETVKEFPEYLKVAQEIFPDIKFEESEE